jgi:hypothetical protein
MLKKIAFSALMAISVAAFSQSNGMGTMNDPGNNGMKSGQHRHWDSDNDWNYDTYYISTVDINSLTQGQMLKLVKRSLRDANAVEADTIESFLETLPPDMSFSLLKALAINYKQASIVRDEVALARFGVEPANYVWLSYPDLTWSSTPGQNSWSAINFDSGNQMAGSAPTNGQVALTMNDNQSRPMRMIMSPRGRDDLNYEQVLDILESGLSDTEQGNIRLLFHPQGLGIFSYTNETELDAITRLVESNSKLADHLDRFAWYNHFDREYYRAHNQTNW